MPDAPLFPENHAMFPTSVSSFVPLRYPGKPWNASVVPARHAYSHSASVGRRRPVPVRKPPGPAIWFHETCSTGRFVFAVFPFSARAQRVGTLEAEKEEKRRVKERGKRVKETQRGALATRNPT